MIIALKHLKIRVIFKSILICFYICSSVRRLISRTLPLKTFENKNDFGRMFCKIITILLFTHFSRFQCNLFSVLSNFFIFNLTNRTN